MPFLYFWIFHQSAFLPLNLFSNTNSLLQMKKIEKSIHIMCVCVFRCDMPMKWLPKRIDSSLRELKINIENWREIKLWDSLTHLISNIREELRKSCNNPPRIHFTYAMLACIAKNQMWQPIWKWSGRYFWACHLVLWKRFSNQLIEIKQTEWFEGSGQQTDFDLLSQPQA